MFKCIVFLLFLSCVKSDNDYFDDVVDMLLNYDDRLAMTDEVEGEQPILSEGEWKCGDCKGVQESNLIYSELNEVDTNVGSDVPVAVQISYALPEMRCIKISGDEVRTFRTVSGACNGDFVTLSVSPTTSYQFTVKVYS